MEQDTSVKVAVRIRPLLDSEVDQNCSVCLRVVPDEPQICVGNDQYFTFDHVFGQDSYQLSIYEECVSDLVDAAFEGFNATILAYGQTGSGKTYTMGSSSSLRLAEEEYGIIPRVIRNLFDTIQAKENQDVNSTYRVRIQFLELYGEDLRDLLDPTSSAKVTIRETPAGGVYISGAREELVTSAEEMLNALEKGSLSRTTGSTLMNQYSSRSHAIFTLLLERTLHSSIPSEAVAADGDATDAEAPQDTKKDKEDIGFARAEPEVRKCKFHFVDLAGSERAKRTGAEGQRLREGIDINKGLLVLGNVISALGDEQKRGKVHVPYRDSKLTRMLQDSLGGNSKTLMICCVSPADTNYNESLNALKYANRARNIQNKPVVNVDPTSLIIHELRRQVQVLASELLSSRGVLPGPASTKSLLEELSLSTKVDVLGSQTQARVAKEVASSGVSSQDRIAYETEIGTLKRRVADGDMEIQRLTEQLRRQKSQASEVTDRLVLLQCERDYFKMKWSEADPEGAKACLHTDRVDDTFGVIEGYVREIDMLRQSLAEMQQAHEQTHRSLILNDGLVNESELLMQSAEDLLEGELTSSVARVISRTQEQLRREERRINAMEGDEDSGSDGEKEHGSDDVEQEDISFHRRQKLMTDEVFEIGESIQLKQQLIQQLQRSQRQYELMKTFYEEKLRILNEEMHQKESEVLKLSSDLQQLASRNEAAIVKQKEEQRLKQQLKEKEEQLRQLKRRQEELNHLSQVQSRSTAQLARLENEIESMKRQRVELTRTLQAEKKRHIVALNHKVKEIEKLKRELVRKGLEAKKLGRDKEVAEGRIKDVLKEEAERRRRMNDVQKFGDNTAAVSAATEAASARVARRALRKTHRGVDAATEAEIKTRRWLEKQARQLAAREEAAEALRRQCEQQLSLIHKKQQLEQSLVSFRDLITKGKPEGDDVKHSLTAEEEDAMSEVEERIQQLDGQLKFRTETISTMSSKLGGRTSQRHNTIEALQRNAASSLPAAHDLIRMLFDMLVSTKRIERALKDQLTQVEDREKKYKAEMEDANNRLLSLKRQHAKELTRIERDYEEKLSGLFNHSTIGQILLSEVGTTLPLDLAVDDNVFPSGGVRPTRRKSLRQSQTNSFSPGDWQETSGSDQYKSMLMIVNERNATLKAHLAREEGHVKDLERIVDETNAALQQALRDVETKIQDTKFLEEECRMLRDMVEDFRQRVSALENGEKIIQEIRASEKRKENGVDGILSDDESDDDDILDSATIAGEFANLAEEINRTGAVRVARAESTGEQTPKNIFDRLTNPSNFTGSQKNVFENDVEIKRAKVKQIKREEAQAQRRRKEEIRATLSDENIGTEEEGTESAPVNLIPFGHDLPQSPIEVEARPATAPSNKSPPSSTTHANKSPTTAESTSPLRVSSRVTHGGAASDAMSTGSREKDKEKETDVFSRLLNPNKFTGIHKHRLPPNDSMDVSTSKASQAGDFVALEETRPTRRPKSSSGRMEESGKAITTRNPSPHSHDSSSTATPPQSYKELNVFQRLQQRMTASTNNLKKQQHRGNNTSHHSGGPHHSKHKDKNAWFNGT